MNFIRHDCSLSKHASTDGFSVGRHIFKMAATTSSHATKCCHLVSKTKRLSTAASVSSWS